MLGNLTKEPIIPFIGTVVKFDDQKEQVRGGGHGWRYKVAIHQYYNQSTAEISDENIEYAIAMLPPTSGSGGAARGQSCRISQGDVVYGHFIGGKRGIPLILGIFGRTCETKYGEGRFDSKTGFYENLQPKNLLKRQETNQQSGLCFPKSLPTNDKSKKRVTPQQ
jgi:hypothetical protein